jgi:hypothetical protein
MKNLSFATFLLACLVWAGSASAQGKEVRLSPQAEVKTTLNGGQNIEVLYSSPAVRGRAIWGELVPYGKVWRTGADEATTFETDKDILVDGKKLPKGKYALFTIPGEKEWTFIFNKDSKQWGTSSYDTSKDVLRVTVPAYKSSYFNESLLIDVSDNLLSVRWENVNVNVPLQ